MNKYDHRQQALLFLEQAKLTARQRRGAATADLIDIALFHLESENKTTTNKLMEVLKGWKA